MMQSPKILFFLGLLTSVASITAPVRADVAKEETKLQPQALHRTGIYALRDIDPNLTGRGVTLAVISRSITYIDDEPQNDYRPSIGHNCFKGMKWGFHNQDKPLPAISPHSTAICSILFGYDPDASHPELGKFYYQGAVPQAQADIYEFWHFLINNVFHHLPPSADIVSVSIGSPFEYWWTRGIESLVEHHGLIVVAGIGNGLNANDPPLYPAGAANVIGVGVIDSANSGDLSTSLSHFSLAYPDHSSLGPTIDRRCKPDIVAPGNCLAANVNEPNDYEPTGDWSSFSTPIVAGTIGLLVQKAKQNPALSAAISPKGGNCVMKAILMNSATKLPYWHKGRLEKDDDNEVPLDYIQGAGMLNAVGAYKHLVAGRNKPGTASRTGWDLNQLDENSTLQNIYRITLTDSTEQFINITATWNKHYNNAYPFEPMPEKDSNLRLELWAVDPEDSGNDYLIDYSDSEIDNVEHIYCRVDANYTNYEIVLSYSNLSTENQTTKTQRYGLAWNVNNAPKNNSIFWYDLNTDGIVDDSDFTFIRDIWINSITSPESYIYGDIDSNGVLDANDVHIFLNNLNRKATWYTN
ncbi:MAG: S8 family serine peptidase [Phycisphaerae bacterium]|nr:S8 family serine peptidase [Phycisphaerae bacterium]NIR66214.1 S8 family serine peptidase [candidate division Zixibacteria bacterium]NIS53836.1 S8 family serine peptidase [Phycisphaerae bacterium]NIU11432.1 S8 family serine peptidase [Phycisphaerae bacterium]NIU58317.1 S8 family serine peptidase [Phycisphaerae bacterium]